jgi:PhzF family phenazine biosynthesis protein
MCFCGGIRPRRFGARYYLADKEVLMAGHPTVATVISLIDRGLVDLTDGQAQFTLEVGAGILPIKVTTGPDGPLVTMTQMVPEFGKIYDPGDIAKVFSLDREDVLGMPQIVSTGTPFCVTVLRNKDALRRAVLNPDVWNALNPPGTPRAGMLEPFLVTLGGETPDGDTYSRLLLPAPMPPEDPFTGAATGCMAAYIWHHGLIEKSEFTAEQGHWMGRAGRAKVTVSGPREAPTGVQVGGHGVVLMRGELSLPAPA